RALARPGGIVMEGRDIGTVVFPEAPAKLFLTAAPAERARRRAVELRARGETVDETALARELAARDRRDSERAHSPLRPARDAVTVDIGYKSEGQIPVAEFSTREGGITVQEGDQVDVYFESADTESGEIFLSRQKAEQFKVWREIEKAFERDGAVEGTIVGKV